MLRATKEETKEQCEREVRELREVLNDVYQSRYIALGKSLHELSQNIGVSKTYVSQFLNDKLGAVSPKFITRIKGFLKASSLCAADERRLVTIMEILDNARDGRAILAALVTTKYSEELQQAEVPEVPEARRAARAQNDLHEPSDYTS